MAVPRIWLGYPLTTIAAIAAIVVVAAEMCRVCLSAWLVTGLGKALIRKPY